MGSLGRLRGIGERGMWVLLLNLIRAAILAVFWRLFLSLPAREEAL